MSLFRNEYALFHPNISKRAERAGNFNRGEIFYFPKIGLYGFYHKNTTY